MNFTAEALPLDGVVLVRGRRFGDARGYFAETWSEAQFGALGIGARFVQENQSLSAQPGTVRGLHFQRPPHAQAKLVRVVAGSVFDVAVDLRAGSPTYGRWCAATLSAGNGDQLFIPRGFAHGFCTTEPGTVVVYKVDAPYEAAADAGLRWDDPDIAVAWPPGLWPPGGGPTLSDKDAVLPALREFTTPFER